MTAPSKQSTFIRDVAVCFEGDDCLPWPYARTRGGYARLSTKDRSTTASRVVCEVVNGPPPTAEHDAAHSCGKGHLGCVNPRHLAWKTCAENCADKEVHGTSNRGTRNPRAKLGEDDVRQIRLLLGSCSQSQLARKFGVSPQLICRINTGRAWWWLT